MQRKGCTPTEYKGNLVLKKKGFNATVRITDDEYTEGNKTANEEYLKFLKSYFNQGEEFLDKLRTEAGREIQRIRNQNYLEI